MTKCQNFKLGLRIAALHEDPDLAFGETSALTQRLVVHRTKLQTAIVDLMRRVNTLEHGRRRR